jgi:hypothetical protein
MGVKEYYLNAAGFDSSTLAAAGYGRQEATFNVAAAKERSHSSSALEDLLETRLLGSESKRLGSEGKRPSRSTLTDLGQGAHSPAEKSSSVGSMPAVHEELQFESLTLEAEGGDALVNWNGMWLPRFVIACIYRQWKILLLSFFTAFTSVCVGLALGDVISMTVLVACLPTLIAFLAHWKCMTSDGSSYPIRWRIGFAVFFVAAFSLSLGMMLNPSAIAFNALEGNSYSIEAAIMIFGVCTGFLIFVFLFWQFYYGGSDQRRQGRRSRSFFSKCCNPCLATLFACYFFGLIVNLALRTRPIYSVICARTHPSYAI